jgi:DNA-binding CsgD family transcriptional regulator
MREYPTSTRIAAALNISPLTVYDHLRNSLRKMPEARTRVDAVVLLSIHEDRRDRAGAG